MSFGENRSTGLIRIKNLNFLRLVVKKSWLRLRVCKMWKSTGHQKLKFSTQFSQICNWVAPSLNFLAPRVVVDKHGWLQISPCSSTFYNSEKIVMFPPFLSASGRKIFPNVEHNDMLPILENEHGDFCRHAHPLSLSRTSRFLSLSLCFCFTITVEFHDF